MKSIIFLLCILTAINGLAQKPEKVIKKLKEKPVFFVDSVNVEASEIMKYDPEDMAVVTVYQSKEAGELLGEDGKDGAVYIITKQYAKDKYWTYFKSKSVAYGEVVSTPESDTTVQYILNDRVLKEKFEGSLFLINDNIFISIEIISKEELLKNYSISNKSVGFLIKSDIPDNLYKGKKKF